MVGSSSTGVAGRPVSGLAAAVVSDGAGATAPLAAAGLVVLAGCALAQV